VVEKLDGQVLFGQEFLNNQAGSFGVGAMQLPNYLTHFKDNSLVITPGDRADIILGALQASVSVNYPKISGIVLTGGIIPEDSILKLIEGLKLTLPIVSVSEGTFEVTNKVGNIKSAIYADNTQKIITSIAGFEKHVNVDSLTEKLITFKSNVERVIRATSRILASGVVDVILLGDEVKIKSKATKLGVPLDLERVTIIDPVTSEHFDDYAETLFELRKHKNVNINMARDFM